MTNRQLQAQKTRAKIIETAQRLIAERDYENVSVDDIVNECGVAKGTFYHYFSSKAEFFSFMERTRYEQLLARLDADRSVSARDKLERYLTGWVEFCLEDNIQFSKQWFQMVLGGRQPEQGGGDTSLDVSMEHVRRCVEEGIAAGQLRPDTPAEKLASDIVFSIIGAVFYRCITCKDFDLQVWARRYIGEMLTFLFEKYGVQP